MGGPTLNVHGTRRPPGSGRVSLGRVGLDGGGPGRNPPRPGPALAGHHSRRAGARGARRGGHQVATGQALGTVWPIAGIFAAGLAARAVAAAGAGVALGLCRVGAALANGVTSFDAGRVLSLTTTLVYYVVAGFVVGYLM